jgi:hypothetical protein
MLMDTCAGGGLEHLVQVLDGGIVGGAFGYGHPLLAFAAPVHPVSHLGPAVEVITVGSAIARRWSAIDAG